MPVSRAVEVERILASALDGKRLSVDEGTLLLESGDLVRVGRAADRIRRKMHGNRVYYRNDLNLNHTNVCVANCGFCSFYRKGHEADAYTLSIPQAVEKAQAAYAKGVDEFHIVGGLHPDLPLDWYEDLFRGLKRVAPRVHIQAMTAVEIDYIAKREALRNGEVLRRMRAAGLSSLPGGGAEIFNQQIRKKMLATKVPTERWLAVHEEAHAQGIRTNATMLYGHVEEPWHRVEHMDILRTHQEKAPGYQAFVPLAYNPEHNELQKRHDLKGTTGLDDLMTCAVARIFLDNFEHVKLPWVTVGKPVAQVALSFGVDDVGGAAFEERILEAAGGHTFEYVQESDLPELIRRAGFSPVLLSGVYEPIEPMGVAAA
ncbi:MAG: radical SAM protein [Methanobacteriota archaeon]